MGRTRAGGNPTHKSFRIRTYIEVAPEFSRKSFRMCIRPKNSIEKYRSNSFRMRTYRKCVRNSFRIRTYKKGRGVESRRAPAFP